MIKYCTIILLLSGSPLFAQEAKNNVERSYSAAIDVVFRNADFELRPKKSAQDKFQVATGFILHSMQELSVSYCMDHLQMYAKVENPFEIDWQDLQSEQELSSRIESCITSDPLFAVGTPRLLR